MAFSSFSKFLMKKWNNKLDTLVIYRTHLYRGTCNSSKLQVLFIAAHIHQNIMGEYRSTSKDLRDRLMSQRPSPLLAVASKRGGMLIGTGAINYSPPSAIQICFSLSFLIAMCFCSLFPSGCDKV